MFIDRTQAAEYLRFNYHGNTHIADVYDEDADLRSALAMLCPDFEYPDHSYKTLAEFLADYAP